MIFLSGGTPPQLMPHLNASLGMILTPKSDSPSLQLSQTVWAADNGCFAQGDTFDDSHWLAWLEMRMAYTRTCLFAVAPDVLSDALATLYRSTPYLDEIRALGFATAFVSQDGATGALVPWDAIDCLFVGGSTAWKFCAASVALIHDAKRRNKWVHIGRVNSLRRLMTAHAVGADSADGTHLKYRPDRYIPQVKRWLHHVNAQMAMEAM